MGVVAILVMDGLNIFSFPPPMEPVDKIRLQLAW